MPHAPIPHGGWVDASRSRRRLRSPDRARFFGLIACLLLFEILQAQQGRFPPKSGIADASLRIPIAELHPDAVFSVPGAPDWLAVTRDSVWVANEPKGSVTRLDAQTNRVAEVIEVGSKPCSGLAFAAGTLWVPLCGDHAIARVDTRHRKVVATIPSAVADSEGGIAIDDAALWVLTDASGTLTRFERKGNRASARVAVAAGSFAVAAGYGALWVTSTDHNVVTRVNPRNHSVVATIPVGPAPRFLAVGEGAVWTLNQGDGSVSRIDPQRNRVIATITVGVPGPGGEIAAGAGSVWVTSFDYPISRIDPGTNAVVQQFTGAGGDSIRVGLGSVWLTNLRAQTVWRLDPRRIAATVRR